jgi:putative membrane protein
MIVRPHVNWFRMLFVWNGSVLRSIIPQLVFMLGVAVVALVTHGRILGETVPLNTTPFTLAGVALTIFLAFRNNASYERFWESRRMWGQIITSARALTSQVICYAPSDRAVFDRLAFVRRLIAFSYALNHQLRKSDASADLRRYLPASEVQDFIDKQYRPVAIVNALRHTLSGLHRRGAISDAQLWMFDAQLNELGAMVAGCERIASTPIPFAYSVLLHRTVYGYCLLLPFGLVNSIGLATPLISLFVSYTMLGLEAIASEIAEPFGTAPHNLALDAMTRTLERSLLELCGEDIPAESRVGRHYQLT